MAYIVGRSLTALNPWETINPFPCRLMCPAIFKQLVPGARFPRPCTLAEGVFTSRRYTFSSGPTQSGIVHAERLYGLEEECVVYDGGDRPHREWISVALKRTASKLKPDISEEAQSG